MTKKAVWISYDLGLKGNYIELFTWLDTLGAKECGEGLAFFSKEYSDDVLDEVKKDLLGHVKLDSTDRIYIIYIDSKTKKVKGNFIHGGRKRAIWEGYSTSIDDVEDSI